MDAADRGSPEAVLGALDPEQRQVATATRGPVCVLAGAGTGKTRAVAHRIAYAVRAGVVEPGHVLAVTFTTRAAGELRGRLRQLGGAPGGGGAGGLELVQARTFHAAALRQLTHFWPRVVGGRAPSVLASKVPLLAEAARALRVSPGPAELRDVASEVEWAKVTQVLPGDYPGAAAKAGRTPPLAAEATARLYAAYEDLRRQRHLIDFESVLELTAAILTEDRLAAEQVRDRYRYFVVDEYQDVNPLQKLLLDAWAGGRDDLCVVGDPRQTIYSFTGATSSYLTGFTAEFPGAMVVRLTRNYRSTPQVVDLANRVTGAVGRGHGGRLGLLLPGFPAGRGAGAGADALAAQRPAGPPPEFAEYADEPDEAAAIARRVRALIREGMTPRQIAVLVRTNGQAPAFERAFAEAGVACQVRGADRFFDRPEVRQALTLLRAAVKSARPGSGPGPGDSAASAAAEVRHILAGLGLTRDVPVGRGAARERWESLEALAQLAEDYLAGAPGAGLAGFTAELSHRAAIEHAPAMEGVTVASLHAAKGLEWDVVFLPGLSDGNLPIVHATTEEAVEEERRLLYVGVTRARERLYLSWALARSPGGRRIRQPSRFLDGIRPGTRAAASDGDARPPARSGQPVSPSGLDSPVARRLREWRRQEARDQGVPAYVVFSDQTLQLIAGRRPGNTAELAAIPGVGQRKLDRYGAAVLALCADSGGEAGG